ncbi:MAG TPA: hypothetical protein DEF36_18550 [Desulfotomaculum sp.]|nr:hypothetical protein [Desulfotomaculum sp.]
MANMHCIPVGKQEPGDRSSKVKKQLNFHLLWWLPWWTRCLKLFRQNDFQYTFVSIISRVDYRINWWMKAIGSSCSAGAVSLTVLKCKE